MLVRAREGQPTPLTTNVHFPVYAKITSLRWDANAEAGRTSLFSGNEQRLLGNMYFTTEDFRASQDQEETVWARMGFVEGLSHFTPADVQELSVLLAEGAPQSQSQADHRTWQSMGRQAASGGGQAQFGRELSAIDKTHLPTAQRDRSAGLNLANSNLGWKVAVSGRSANGHIRAFCSAPLSAAPCVAQFTRSPRRGESGALIRQCKPSGLYWRSTDASNADATPRVKRLLAKPLPPRGLHHRPTGFAPVKHKSPARSRFRQLPLTMTEPLSPKALRISRRRCEFVCCEAERHRRLLRQHQLGPFNPDLMTERVRCECIVGERLSSMASAWCDEWFANAFSLPSNTFGILASGVLLARSHEQSRQRHRTIAHAMLKPPEEVSSSFACDGSPGPPRTTLQLPRQLP